MDTKGKSEENQKGTHKETKGKGAARVADADVDESESGVRALACVNRQNGVGAHTREGDFRR